MASALKAGMDRRSAEALSRAICAFGELRTAPAGVATPLSSTVEADKAWKKRKTALERPSLRSDAVAGQHTIRSCKLRREEVDLNAFL